MRHNVVLIVTSLLTILFMTIHGAQDIQAGIAPQGIATYHDVFFIWILLALGATAILAVVVWALGLSLAHEVAARDAWLYIREREFSTLRARLDVPLDRERAHESDFTTKRAVDDASCARRHRRDSVDRLRQEGV